MWKKNTFRAYSLVALVRLQTRDISLFTMVGPLAKYPGQRNSTKKIVSNRDSIRTAREAFLIQKGRTIDPNGLNIREETY